MLISLQELQLRPVRFKVNIPVGEIDFDTKLKQSSPLCAEGSARLITKALGEVRVEGDLQVTVNGICDRCTEPASCELKNHFDLVYMPASDGATGGEDEIDEAGVEVGYYDGNALELNEILREVVLLAMPMQMVCEEDCRGICPICGENKNQADCNCAPAMADDRWNKLRALRAEIGPQN